MFFEVQALPGIFVVMDVVNPRLEEIDGAMYRINLTEYPGSESSDGAYVEDESEFTKGECKECYDAIDPNYLDSPIIEEIKESRNYYRFRTQLSIPKVMYGLLIGTKGQTLHRLENETCTKIIIPKKHEESDIVVMGFKERQVRASYSAIRSIVERGRNKLLPTHFISIPLNAPNIRVNFEIFKNQVLECCRNEQDIVKNELFNIPEKLHLTLSVLVLLDEEERGKACSQLDDCLKNVIEYELFPLLYAVKPLNQQKAVVSRASMLQHVVARKITVTGSPISYITYTARDHMPVLKNQAIVVRVKGIDIMNDDPTRAKILYAKVESKDDMLQRLADEVFAFYKKSGLATDQFDRDYVKLHVTLMNTSFFLPENENLNSFRRQKNCHIFDASKILMNFENFDFGEVVVNSMHLSQCGAYSEDGYYLSSNIIKWA